MMSHYSRICTYILQHLFMHLMPCSNYYVFCPVVGPSYSEPGSREIASGSVSRPAGAVRDARGNLVSIGIYFGYNNTVNIESAVLLCNNIFEPSPGVPTNMYATTTTANNVLLARCFHLEL